MTLQSVAASLTEKAAADLIAAANATPEDKAKWLPGEKVRPVLDQLVECCLANRMWTRVLQTQVYALLPDGAAGQAYVEIDTVDKAIQCLQETSSQLADVIRSLPEDALTAILVFPWKPEAGKPIAECCFHACWNMTYHLGQISYLQTLYGDEKEHSNAGPFG